MTVCIAAINQGIVIGASDRMITSGDIEFEPEVMQKFYLLTPSIIALWAGDAGFQREVLNAVAQRLRDRPPKNGRRVTVHEVTELYVKEWQAARHRRAVGAVLAPLGITADQLLHKKHGLSDDLVGALFDRLTEFQLSSETETIITGLDTAFPGGATGAHIYRIVDDDYWCEDATCFAAIGVGAWHANSQFMLEKYHAMMSPAKALWRVYMAKRWAEAAPGVGAGTDMFTLGPKLDESYMLEEWVPKLDAEYKKYEEGEKAVDKGSIQTVSGWLEERAKERAAATPLAPAPPPSAKPRSRSKRGPRS